MLRFSSFQDARDAFRPRTALIGNFDGVHRGHQHLIHEALQLEPPVAAITFCPHPAALFTERGPSAPLSTLDQKLSLLSQYGVDGTIVIAFTREFAHKPPEEFLSSLANDLRIDHLVIGEGFRFGRARAGTTEFIKEQLRSSNVEVHVIRNLLDKNLPVSSTRIRRFISEGNVVRASELLGRPYCVSGKVVHGLGIGASIGWPTANLSTDQLTPMDGVYVGVATIESRQFRAVISVGRRETINEGLPRDIEVHLLNQNRNLYGTTITIDFLEYLRPQKKFGSKDELSAAIQVDISRAHHFLETCND